MAVSLDYKDDILKKLIAMKYDEPREVEKNEEYEKKVEAIKIIIDWEQDWKNGFTITFNNNYTKIIKHKIVKI